MGAVLFGAPVTESTTGQMQPAFIDFPSWQENSNSTLLASNPLEDGAKWIGNQIKDSYYHNVEHRYRGHELEKLNEIPSDSWRQAYDAFPELQEVAKLSQLDASLLMKAIVANELDHYGKEDYLEDVAAKGNLWGLVHDRTIGYAQIKPDGVRALAQELQRDVNNGERDSNPLAAYLKENMSDKKLLKALEDPKQIPLFVAGNLAHNTRMYHNHGYRIDAETLSYGFNPDRPDSTGKHNHSLLPSDKELAKSEHVYNVTKWMNRIQD